MARRQRRHLGVIAGLDRRVLQAAVARNSKFIDDAGQSALFFGCRKGSADPEDSRRQRRDEQQANFPFVHVWPHWRYGVGLVLFSNALSDSISGSMVAIDYLTYWE